MKSQINEQATIADASNVVASAKKKKNKTLAVIIWSLVAAIVVTIGVCGYLAYKDYQTIMAQVPIVKNEVKEMVSNILSDNVPAAKYSENSVRESINTISEILKKPMWQLATKVPKYGEWLITASTALNLADGAFDELLDPALDLIKNNPLSGLKVEESYNVGMVMEYLEFFEDKLPIIKNLVSNIGSLDVAFIDEEGKIAGYLDEINGYFDLYENNTKYIDLFKTIVGDGEDRLYFLICQNSAEMRASGGFLGSMSTIRIQNGFLSVGSFDSWYPFLTETTYYDPYYVTLQEENLFGEWSQYPCAVTFIPDYPKVASVIARSYEALNKEPIDGVISLTPAIIQGFLKYAGEFSISDGSVINGENATKFLQYDIYFKYQNADMVDMWATNDYVDSLFEEAAFGALDKITEDIDLDKLLGYIDAFETAADERVFQMWMADEDEQAFIEELGYSGKLNDDPQNPEIGIYFSNWASNKLGGFYKQEVEIGDAVINADGTRSYTVSLTMTNDLTDEEIRIGGFNWICGEFGGGFRCILNLFAPAGGTISYVSSERGIQFTYDTYKNLNVASVNNFMLWPQDSTSFTFTVTTAPGVTAVPTLSTTPNIYRYIRN